MKVIKVLFILTLILITGCENSEEENKNEYLAMKSDLLENDNFQETDNINCDITVSIDRINEEEVSYRVIIDNPKENMYNIKAMVVHNYYTEDIFPSLGLFDDQENLIIGDNNVKGIELVGYIKTTKDIDKLNLELKVWIEYTDDNGKTKDIYYKTT